MEWVFNSLVEWLLDMISNAFDAFSEGIIDVLGMNLDTFNQFFSFFGTGTDSSVSLFAVFQVVGFVFVMLLVIMRLFNNLLAPATGDYEDPLTLVLRGMLGGFLVVWAGRIMSVMLSFMALPYQQLSNQMEAALGEDATSVFGAEGTKFREMFSETGTIGNSVVASLVTIGLLVAIFMGYIKLLGAVAERYITTCVCLYCSPLAFSAIATKNTSKIFATYIRVMFSQAFLMLFNSIFVYGVQIAIKNYTQTGANSYIGPFTFCVLLLAFENLGTRLDHLLRSMGLDTGQMAGDLGRDIMGGFNTLGRMGRSMMAAGKGIASLGKKTGGAVSDAKSSTAGTRASGAMHSFGETLRDSSPNKIGQSVGGAFASQAERSARKMIGGGAFADKDGASCEALRNAVTTAAGRDALAALGVDMSSLQGMKNGDVKFKTEGGAKGTMSFSPHTGSGWQQVTDANGKPAKMWVSGESGLGMDPSRNSTAAAGKQIPLSQAIGASGAAAMAVGAAAAANPDALTSQGLQLKSAGGGKLAVMKDGKATGVTLGGSDAAKGIAAGMQKGDLASAQLVSDGTYGGFVTAQDADGKTVVVGHVDADQKGMIGAEAGAVAALSGAEGLSAASLGDGTFSVMDADGNVIGRATDADAASGIDGAEIYENGLGGSAAFIPAADQGLMDSIDMNGENGYVNLGGGKNISADDFKGLAAGEMESANISSESMLSGYSYDEGSDTITARFTDAADGSEHEISMDGGGIRSTIRTLQHTDGANAPDIVSNSERARTEFAGLEGVCSPQEYRAQTGAVPMRAEYSGGVWTVNNQDGTVNTLTPAADPSVRLDEKTRYVTGGSLAGGAPLVVRRAKSSGKGK